MQVPILKRLFPLIFSLAVTSLCLFASSGRVSWPNAWILLGLNFSASITAMVLALA